jgi:lipopolysaccharide transport system ATP-binding protein
MPTTIEVTNLSKKYVLGRSHATVKDLFASFGNVFRRSSTPKEEFWALDDVSFEVQQGDALGILGRNGAGKSTTLKILSRITRPTSGRAILRGRVGSLLEVGTGFHPELSGRENILLNGAILGMRRAEITRKFDQIVEFASLEEFIDTPVKRYSTGMSMRLAFSVAAHLEPEILLVDEVLAVGDQEFQRKCLGRMNDLQSEGRTVVLISHNMGAIQRVCNRALLLDNGRVAAEGPTKDVVEDYHRLTAPQSATPELADVVTHPTFATWELRSPMADDVYLLRSGDPCEMVFRLLTPDPIQRAFFGISIFTSDGTLATSVSTLDAMGTHVDLEHGAHDIVLKFDSLPLGPGQYTVFAALNAQGRGRIEAWNGTPPFEVVRRSPSVQVPPAWEGIVHLEPNVSVTTVDAGRP